MEVNQGCQSQQIQFKIVISMEKPIFLKMIFLKKIFTKYTNTRKFSPPMGGFFLAPAEG